MSECANVMMSARDKNNASVNENVHEKDKDKKSERG